DPERGLAVGDTLDTSVTPGDFAGPQVTYTITPQPLPDNITFNRQTGELRFAPDPDQVGHYRFTVTASDGTHTAVERVPITVVRRPRPSTEVTGRVVDARGGPWP